MVGVTLPVLLAFTIGVDCKPASPGLRCWGDWEMERRPHFFLQRRGLSGKRDSPSLGCFGVLALPCVPQGLDLVPQGLDLATQRLDLTPQ